MNILFYNKSISHKDMLDKNFWIPDAPDSEFVIEYYCSNLKNIDDVVYLDNHLYQKINDKHPLKLVLKPYVYEGVPITKKDIIFYTQSDTLSNSLIEIISHSKFTFSYDVFIPKYNSEKAEIPLAKKGISFSKFELKHIFRKRSTPTLLILFNDWTKEAQRIILWCRIFNIPTICIQESIIDFGDSKHRMQHADDVFIQGIRTTRELSLKNYFVVGNPRYDQLKRIKSDTKKHIVINCNFTYNIYEQVRQKWLQDIVRVLTSFQEEYVIIQHPRDHGDLSMYDSVIKTNADSILDVIQNAKFIITRFSSIIHEGLVLKKPIIYYNPHHESMKYDFEFNNDFLFYTSNPKEMENAIKKLLKNNIDLQKISYYTQAHCTFSNLLASENVSEAIKSYTSVKVKMTIYEYIKLVILSLRDLVYQIKYHFRS